ncbi:MAG: MBL fold metallo-hydrolase [Alphaproteobacteria bacterium]|nr:MBL fold metallo-hydrolase [Alphaproteobacteria bacterium]
MPEADHACVLVGFGVSAERMVPECTVALCRDGAGTVLFDAGAGPDLMSSTGALIDSLDATGVAPDEVTHVVFTHADPDHIRGLIDEFDELVSSEATCMMARVE